MATAAMTRQNEKKGALLKFLEARRGQIEAAAEKHLSPDRQLRMALTATIKTPKLLECSPESFYLSMLTASQLGIELNGRDGHLVPYGKEVVFV